MALRKLPHSTPDRANFLPVEFFEGSLILGKFLHYSGIILSSDPRYLSSESGYC